MPVSFRVDLLRNRVVTHGVGTVTGDDFARLRVQIRSHPDVTRDMDHLVDLREVEEYAVPGAEVHRLAQGADIDEPAAPGVRVAIVTASPVGFGLARMYELSRSAAPEDIEVFNDVDEALEWLEREGDRERKAAPGD